MALSRPGTSRARPRWLAAVAYLLVGVVITVLLALALTWWVPLPGATGKYTLATSDNQQWTVTRWSGVGSTLVHSAPHGGLNWSPVQMTGPPDAGVGDNVRAWASQTPDGQREWVRLDYGTALHATGIRWHANHAPGAVDEVRVSAGEGSEDVIVWQGKDPIMSTFGSGVTAISIDVDFPVRFVQLSLDSVATPGWNEIDAVALTTADGQDHWAIDATASSTYATVQFPILESPQPPRTTVPFWSRIPHQLDEPARGGADIVEEARGLPFAALRCVLTPPTTADGDWTVHGGIRLSEQRILDPRSNLRIPTVLPLTPIWTGLVLDSVIVAIIARLCMLLLTRPIQYFRHIARVSYGRCPRCRHDLRYQFSLGCSECGWMRQPEA
jgi:hypothetical protein